MLSYVVPTVDLAVATAAGMTIVVLLDVATLVGTMRLRRAWRSLGGMLACCILLLFVHAAVSLGHPASVQDLVGGAIFLIGVSFILGIACLSRSTARDMLRVERVAQVAHLDALTGIGNRRHFDESLDAAVSDATRRHSSLSIIAFDIDHFKDVNDALGHAVGDDVLRTVARIAIDTVRAAGTVCRVGGEEFAVIVPRTDPAFVPALAEQLRASVAARRIETDGRSLSITVSLGLATFVQGETGAELLRRADSAMYTAKRAGRDRLRMAV